MRSPTVNDSAQGSGRPDLMLILERSSPGVFQLWACRWQGPDCQGCKQRGQHCPACVAAKPGETIQALIRRVTGADA